jgi:hypothetical protein
MDTDRYRPPTLYLAFLLMQSIFEEPHTHSLSPDPNHAAFNETDRQTGPNINRIVSETAHGLISVLFNSKEWVSIRVSMLHIFLSDTELSMCEGGGGYPPRLRNASLCSRH